MILTLIFWLVAGYFSLFLILPVIMAIRGDFSALREVAQSAAGGLLFGLFLLVGLMFVVAFLGSLVAR